MMTSATPATLTLAELLDDPALTPFDNLTWRDLKSDSRTVKAGDVFVAAPGARVHGREFIDQAIAQGAVVVLEDAAATPVVMRSEVPVIAVEGLPRRLSYLAGRCYGEPSHLLDVIGITGTNGKTTTSLLIAQLLEALGRPAAVVGTLGYGRADDLADLTSTGFTTPDAIAAQQVLQCLHQAGVASVAMEVSSHSLAQRRVEAVEFTTAVFTNLSHDHLDYHGDLKAYGKAKARLLKFPGLGQVVINRDDAWAKTLLKKTSESMQVVSYSVGSDKADVYITDIEYLSAGLAGTLHSPAGSGRFESTLVGEFNASNLLAAVCVALLRGFDLDQVLAKLPGLLPAPGRMQQVRIAENQDIQVVVDYAHTPDALEKALRALARHTEGQVWCVFGCGGDRDREKRAVMGRVAEKAADYVIVTNDNPRGEDPAAIVSDIVHGMHNPGRCLTIADRDKAIDLAVQQAHSGDTVLLAGKGHEREQMFADYTVAFSDLEQAEAALSLRLKKRAEGDKP